MRGASFAVASEVCGTNALPSEEMARLFAAAPALRRAVIALHERVAVHEEEIERETAERDVERAEVLSLRAIIEGRTTPPTDAEIAAHDGPWLVVKDHASGYCTKVVYGDDAVSLAAQQRAWPKIRAWVWHPFDERDGEMKAWPVVAEESK